MATRAAFTGFREAPRDIPVEYALDYHGKENPEFPAFVHPTENGQLKYITYGEAVPAIHRAGRAIAKAIDFDISKGVRAVTPIVALLAQTDSLSYMTVLAGLLRAGITAFPISPRFSPEVVAHVIKTGQPQFLIVTEATKSLGKAVISELKLLENCERAVPCMLDIPQYKDLYPGNNLCEPLPNHQRKMDEIAIISHSSGSSAKFPKVIYWTPLFALYSATRIDYCDIMSSGKIFASPGLELFHAMGLLTMLWMIRAGYIIGLLNPKDMVSTFPPDMNVMFKCIELMNPTFVYLTPRIIELWSEDPYKVKMMKKCTITTAGRFLNKFVGDRLIKEGVNIITMFGSTESSGVAMFNSQEPEDWEYWTVHPRPDIQFIARNDGLYEMVVLLTAENSLPAINTTLYGQPGYNLGDLFHRHPTKPHTYRMFGRLSDQIMLATGQMVNPIPTEEAICHHPSASSAVIFGHTRFSLGVIIEPKAEYGMNKMDSSAKESFIANLWPVIDKANRESPAHARISKDMIIVASNDKPFMYSLKGLPKRPTVWHEYQQEIDVLYRADFRK